MYARQAAVYASQANARYTPLVQLSGQQQMSARGPPLQMLPMSQQAGFHPSMPMSSSSSARQAPLGDIDIVQFASPFFFANEDSRKAVVTVIRIGSLAGSCSVRYKTRDSSAKAGYKYKKKEGRIEFGPGEHSRCCEVEIIDDDNFDTTIEFDVLLDEPDNCITQCQSDIARILIIDDDLFPSNKFAKEIAEGSDSALHKVGFSLLWSFMKFCFVHVSTIWWKSLLAILLAQLGNAYYLMTIYLKVYLVDVCLNIKDESTMDKLFIKNDRAATAMVLGAAWVLPNFILTASDFLEMAVLEMGFNIRKHLRVNLFRKYLNYTEESRKEVPIQDLKTSMMEDIPDLVSQGYLIAFELWRIFGKIAMVSYFMLRKHPSSSFPLAVYPMVMLAWLSCRYKKRLKLLSEQGDGESDTMGWLLKADNAHRLITDYKQRSYVINKFEEVLNTQRVLTMNLKFFTFWNELLVPWITIMAVGTYMAFWGRSVVKGELTLGGYLAMINVYKDLGDRFEGLHNCFTSLAEAIDPLSGLTVQFNLPTDVGWRQRTSEQRREYVEQWIASHPTQPGGPSPYDMIPITLKEVSVEYSPSLRDASVSISAPQGQVILIRGPHDSGKSTIVSLLTDNLSEFAGNVLCPQHLRILHVSYQPVLVNELGPYGNLTFGKPEDEPEDLERIKRILARVKLDKPALIEFIEADYKAQKGKREKAAQAAAQMAAEDRFIDMISQEGEGLDEEEKGLTLPIKKRTSNGHVSENGSEEEEDEEENEDEAEDDEQDDWTAHLSFSERKRFHLARAFIHNPEVMVLHRPVDEMDPDLSDRVLGMLREFVDNRGVEVSAHDRNRRRPRTAFFSAGTVKKTNIEDVVWKVGDGKGIQALPGSGRGVGF